MGTIRTNEELQKTIQFFETEQAEKLKQMKNQFYLAYDSLKPVNLIESTLKEIASSPFLIDNIWSTAMGLVSGYFSKKVAEGKSGNKLRKLFGAIIQFGITNIIIQNPSALKNVGKYISQNFFHKKRD